jgi:hypothetical protein
MIDKDLAVLYWVKPIALRQQVARNKERFPEDFMFQLNDAEVDVLVSQNVIPSRSVLGGYRPYVFTEQGVAMLSSVLRSRRAVLANVQIMRAFVRLRKILATYKELARKLEELEKKYDAQFRVVFDAIRRLMKEDEKPKGKIGFHP